MSLELYYHPLASYCWKVLLALYENGTPFEPRLIDLSDPKAAAKLAAIWPIRKFPVLRDSANERTIPEASLIIEYLGRHHPGAVPLVPADPERSFETRQRDRFFDLYVHEPMQKIVGDKIRPPGMNDPHGVEQARALLLTAYGMIEREIGTKQWAMGDAFTLADCSAAPAMYYANRVAPLGDAHPRATAYLGRLMDRPSFARVFEEAGPYLAMFPG